MRLIDADAFVEANKDIIDNNIDTNRYEVTLRELINEAPTIDRPHGKWIEHKWAEEFDGHLISNYECSCCHSWKRENTDFCPNCGSDNRPRKHGCCFADETCKNNPCADCGLREGEEE